MNIGVLADIHGNHIALEACLEDAKKYDVSHWIVLGDVVDRCPGINETFELLETLAPQYLKGNHEETFAELHNSGRMIETLTYQHKVIEERFLKIVNEMAASPNYILYGDTSPLPQAIFTHGNFRFPYNWGEYIDCEPQIIDEFGAFSNYGEDAMLGVVGHTHQPFIAQIDETGSELTTFEACTASQTVNFAEKRTYVVAPSVGVPRDHSPNTGYVVINPTQETATVRRVPYSTEALFEFARSCKGYPIQLLYDMNLDRI